MTKIEMAIVMCKLFGHPRIHCRKTIFAGTNIDYCRRCEKILDFSNIYGAIWSKQQGGYLPRERKG